jgi:hypothetical protein
MVGTTGRRFDALRESPNGGGTGARVLTRKAPYRQPPRTAARPKCLETAEKQIVEIFLWDSPPVGKRQNGLAWNQSNSFFHQFHPNRLYMGKSRLEMGVSLDIAAPSAPWWPQATASAITIAGGGRPIGCPNSQ